MKRMTMWILIGAGGITVCGYLVLRQTARTTGVMPVPMDQPVRNLRPLDAWQGSIRVDGRTDYRSDPAKTKQLREKLRQEELRQRPWEGRN